MYSPRNSWLPNGTQPPGVVGRTMWRGDNPGGGKLRNLTILRPDDDRSVSRNPHLVRAPMDLSLRPFLAVLCGLHRAFCRDAQWIVESQQDTRFFSRSQLHYCYGVVAELVRVHGRNGIAVRNSHEFRYEQAAAWCDAPRSAPCIRNKIISLSEMTTRLF